MNFGHCFFINNSTMVCSCIYVWKGATRQSNTTEDASMNFDELRRIYILCKVCQIHLAWQLRLGLVFGFRPDVSYRNTEIRQRQPQDGTRIFEVLGLGATYIRDLTVYIYIYMNFGHCFFLNHSTIVYSCIYVWKGDHHTKQHDWKRINEFWWTS